MKHLLLGFVILLPTLASADVIIKPAANNISQQAILTGEDAADLKSQIDLKSFSKDTHRGVNSISCKNDECRIGFHGDVIYRAGQGEYKRETDELNTFDQTFSPSDSENLISIPSGAWFFHTRDEVLESDKALFKYLSSKKNAVKDELEGNKTVSIEGKNFKLSCMKNKKPERFEMAKCLGPHSGCLPSIFSKFIRITHQCRSYLKATPK